MDNRQIQIGVFDQLLNIPFGPTDLILVDFDEVLLRLCRKTGQWKFMDQSNIAQTFQYWHKCGSFVMGFTARHPQHHDAIQQFLSRVKEIRFRPVPTMAEMRHSKTVWLHNRWIEMDSKHRVSSLESKTTQMIDGIVYGAYGKKDGPKPWWQLGKGGMLLSLLRSIPLIFRPYIRRVVLIDDLILNLDNVGRAIQLLKSGWLADKTANSNIRWTSSIIGWNHLQYLPIHRLVIKHSHSIRLNTNTYFDHEQQQQQQQHRMQLVIRRNRFLAFLDRHDIVFWAWDFDQTIISIHTGTGSHSTIPDLLPYVSWPFLWMVHWIIRYRPHIRQAITSFSDAFLHVNKGAEFIRRFLDKALSRTISRSAIPVIISYCPTPSVMQRWGKQKHLQKAVMDSGFDPRALRQPHRFVLTDDDPHNQKCAKEQGWTVLQVAKKAGFTWMDFDRQVF